MIIRFIFIFLLAFFLMTFLMLCFFSFLTIFAPFINGLLDIKDFFSKEAWVLSFEGLHEKTPRNLAVSIYTGVMSGAAIVIIYLCDRSIVPDLRTRCIGFGILAVFMASLFFLAKYYGLIPLKNAFA
jgi:hypothetical protein